MVSVLERFLDKVIPEPNSGCWLWLAGIHKQGYGLFWFEGETQLAHRVSYKLLKEGLTIFDHVLYKCDNPYCVNPEHLRLGCAGDNIADAIAKGRWKNPPHQYGETHSTAKLTEAQVREIKNLYTKGDLSNRQIAERFNVNKETVRLIGLGINWSHVQ